MSFKPFFSLLRNGRLGPLLRVGADLKSFYRLTYLAAAGKTGLLQRLTEGPCTLDSLIEFCAAHDQGREALLAWLQMGVRLQLLRSGPRGYSLRGLASDLAWPKKRSDTRHGAGSGRSTSQAHRGTPRNRFRRAKGVRPNLMGMTLSHTAG